jgi:hypothetical protein
MDVTGYESYRGYESAHVLGAAVTIRDELTRLVPTDADALGTTLDAHIARARAVSPAERAELVDDIVAMLVRREPTRLRFQQLLNVFDASSGIPERIWAADWLTAGKVPDDVDDSGPVPITCRACGYVNNLAYRPPEDDRPACQNPQPPSHLLEMA